MSTQKWCCTPDSQLIAKVTMTKKNIINIIFLLCILSLPLYMAFIHIHNSTESIVFADEWAFLNIIDKFYDGQLALQDMWAQHNEHRYVLLKAIFIISAKINALNVQNLMYISLIIILLSTLLFYFQFKKINTCNEGTKLTYVFLPVPFLMFSLGQWENLLWGMQLFVFLMVMFVILSILLMDQALRQTQFTKYFFLAISSSLLATFSFGIGILIWIVVSLQIMLHGFNQSNLKKLASYSVIGIAVISIYSYGLQTSSNVTYLMNHLDKAFLYVMVNIGNSLIGEFSTQVVISFVFGLIILLLYVYAIFIYFGSDDNLKTATNVFLMLIIFSMLSSLAIVYGRIQLGIEQSASSRHSTFSLLGVTSLYLFWAHYASLSEKFSKYQIVLLTLIFVGLTASTYEEWNLSIHRKHYYQNLENIQLNSEKLSDAELRPLWEDVNAIREGIKTQKKYHLGVFRKDKVN